MSLKTFLSSKPNVDKFLSRRGNQEILEVLGITPDQINNTEALTDVVLLVKAMNGDISAKRYIDDRVAEEKQSSAFKKTKS